MEQVGEKKTGTDELLRKLHERPQIPLTEWLRLPAHVHYQAFRMADSPTDRPASREEFRRVVEAFQLAPNHTVLRETFGYGVKVAVNGDRLIVVWQAHTEYYSYQIWHLPRIQEFIARPVHDWASHGADAFRYLAVHQRTPRARDMERETARDVARAQRDIDPYDRYKQRALAGQRRRGGL